MQVIFEPNRDSIIRHLKDIAPTIQDQFGVIRIGLFGSFIREEQTSNSDVDILVELTEGYNTLRNFISLADYLEALFNRKVDLITVQGLDPYIRPYVEKEVFWIEG